MHDAIGNEHAPCEGTPRIACLVPSITELLFDLGLGEYVVARTGFCIHPAPQVLEVPKVGGTKDVNIKKLLSLNPSYIIVNIDENRKEVIEEIRKTAPQVAFGAHLQGAPDRGIAVRAQDAGACEDKRDATKQTAPQVQIVVTHPSAPEDNAALYALLGFIFRCEDKANTLIAQLHAALAEARTLTQALPRERVLYLIWKDPWMTVGADTYIARTLATVGWDCAQPEPEAGAGHATKKLRYPSFLEDNSMWRSVERVLLSSEPFHFGQTHLQELARFAPQAQWQLIDGEITSWYGSRAIPSMRALAHIRLAASKKMNVTQRPQGAN
jgi:ABC-type hemin transport system substrate-binding protein